MATIEYFYAAHSAFAYLGSRRFYEIVATSGSTIIHRPYDLRRGMLGVGSILTRDRTPGHRAYFFGREIERWSEQRDAPIMSRRPTHHDNDITLPNCVLIAAQVLGAARGANNVDTLAHALLQAHWRDDANLADATTLAALARGVGLDPVPLLAAAATDDILRIYNANTDAAINRSVFGSPTYVVDGDMFYGQDRLEMVERAMRLPYRTGWPAPA